jgi:hypothetical protein
MPLITAANAYNKTLEHELVGHATPESSCAAEESKRATYRDAAGAVNGLQLLRKGTAVRCVARSHPEVMVHAYLDAGRLLASGDTDN